MSDPKDRPVVRVPPSNRYPTRRELDEDMRIPTTPEALARIMGRQVRIEHENPPDRDK